MLYNLKFCNVQIILLLFKFAITIFYLKKILNKLPYFSNFLIPITKCKINDMEGTITVLEIQKLVIIYLSTIK